MLTVLIIRYLNLLCTDGELLRSDETMASLCQLPSLSELHIGQNENFVRANDFKLGVALSKLSQIAIDTALQKLKILHLCGSIYLFKNGDHNSLSIDEALMHISRTFVNLKVLTVKYGGCLLDSVDAIKSLGLLTHLETLDLRKSEISVLKVSTHRNYSVERTTAWCDEYLPYFPMSLKTIYIETGKDILFYFACIFIFLLFIFLRQFTFVDILSYFSIFLFPSLVFCCSRSQCERYLSIFRADGAQGVYDATKR